MKPIYNKYYQGNNVLVNVRRAGSRLLWTAVYAGELSLTKQKVRAYTSGRGCPEFLSRELLKYTTE